MRTRKCLGGLLGAAMALTVGVTLASRASAEQKVPVRTALFTAHDAAAIKIAAALEVPVAIEIVVPIGSVKQTPVAVTHAIPVEVGTTLFG